MRVQSAVSIHVIWVPEGEEKQKGHNKIFEETITMFLTWERLVIQVQEAQRVPYRINPKRNTPRHTAIKMEKIKENKLKAAREKQQRTPIRL